MVQERLPTLGAIGDLVGFLWVDRLAVDPEILVPKRWDAATTREALAATAETVAAIPAVVFEADELKSHRSVPLPRGVAGRPATCSWRSALP